MGSLTNIIRTPASQADRDRGADQLSTGQGTWLNNDTVVLQGKREEFFAEVNKYGEVENAYYEDRIVTPR